MTTEEQATESTGHELIEGMYQKMWKDFVSLQRGDARLICEDAARYRWLCENRDVLLLTGFFGDGCINRTIAEVHAAIDAAMLKTPNVQVSGLPQPDGDCRHE